ncbi:expressed unknown protein [Seminavis robusta]|uniref:Uncharacterized protein n=1 Tax=Seminavis robusta TaxID=568900 RepID=A0A9N8DBC6_9STRA|nr:expressed unknown protein [Seminavis robusta]|eukprot:Sro19_g013260.1 n/a (115) ;mRNA; r:24410-24754
MGSNTFLVSVILLFVGTLAAVVTLKSQGRSVETNKIVPLPQIGGMALRRGPWPGCLGLEASKCVDIVTSYAPKVEIEVITLEMAEEVADDFNPNRVRIYLDEDGLVAQIPLRGR